MSQICLIKQLGRQSLGKNSLSAPRVAVAVATQARLHAFCPVYDNYASKQAETCVMRPTRPAAALPRPARAWGLVAGPQAASQGFLFGGQSVIPADRQHTPMHPTELNTYIWLGIFHNVCN